MYAGLSQAMMGSWSMRLREGHAQQVKGLPICCECRTCSPFRICCVSTTVLYCTGMYWSVAFSQSLHDAITSYDMHAGGGSTHSLLRQKHYIGHPVQAPSLLQPSRRTSEMTSSNLIGGQAVVHSTTSCSRGAGKILHT